MFLFHVLNTSQGWSLTVALIPAERDGRDWMKYQQGMDTETLKYFVEVHTQLTVLLEHLSVDDMSRPTVRKNTMYDLSRVNVLEPDQGFYLTLIDNALANTAKNNSLRTIVILTKFGQKQRSDLNLCQLCEVARVKSVSIHTACDIQSKCGDYHHFWSKYALQKLVGLKGSVFAALSMREAVNFQSNLDGKKMDISKPLQQIVVSPEQLTFIQLYADTPHNRTRTYYSHPVSGEIVCCGLMHHMTARAMSNRSRDYLLHMREHTRKLQTCVAARVEVVTLCAANQMCRALSGRDFFDVPKLRALIEQEPMLLPFEECGAPGGNTFTSLLRELPTHLCDTLQAALDAGRGTGRFTESWTAFQAEIALEVFFWGRPSSKYDSVLAANLGPATDKERSLTWERGILGLAPVNSATLEDTPPPLLYWTKDEKQKARIQRVFAFADYVEAAFPVVGKRLLRVVLSDLLENNNLSREAFTKNVPPSVGRCTGTLSTGQLVEQLLKVKMFAYPYTYGRAAALLEAAGKPVRDILDSALTSLAITFFPAIKLHDETRNAKVSWNKRDYWNVLAPLQNPTPQAKAALFEADVVVELISRGLTFEKNLAAAKENGMPWMLAVLERLDGERRNLSRPQLVTVCTFLSCIALLQQGVYVDYNSLSRLEMALPVTQARLRLLQIQSKNILPAVSKLTIYRLDHEIPFKITPLQVGLRQVKPDAWHEQQQQHQQQAEDFEDLLHDDNEQQQTVTHTPSLALPAGYKMRWSSQELDLAHQAIQAHGGSASMQAYKLYVDLCINARTPTRTHDAFKKKGVTFRLQTL